MEYFQQIEIFQNHSSEYTWKIIYYDKNRVPIAYMVPHPPNIYMLKENAEIAAREFLTEDKNVKTLSEVFRTNIV